MDIVNEIIKLKSDGIKITEIAERLNIPVGTVKSKLFRLKTKEPVEINEPSLYRDINNKCKMCGREITVVVGKKKRQFCCDYCRVKFWRKHKNGDDGIAKWNWILPYKTYA